MKTRTWIQIERRASVDAFAKWLNSLKPSTSWRRGSICACPLNSFIEDVTGYNLSVNSPELSEHWAERPTQSWPTPWWMTWILRSVDHTAQGDEKTITVAQLRDIFNIGVQRDWRNPLMSPADLLEVAA